MLKELGNKYARQMLSGLLKSQLGIYRNPKLRRFQDTNCIGTCDFENEGTSAAKAALVKDGVLNGLLNTRAQIPAAGNALNGHVRTAKHQCTVPEWQFL